MLSAIVIDDAIFFCNLLADSLESLSLEVSAYKSPEEFFSGCVPEIPLHNWKILILSLPTTGCPGCRGFIAATPARVGSIFSGGKIVCKESLSLLPVFSLAIKLRQVDGRDIGGLLKRVIKSL